jgi:SnoaL-like domain
MLRIATTLLLLVLTAAHSGAAEKVSKNERKGAPEMTNKGAPEITNQEAWTLYKKYLQGWNSTSDDIRKKVAAETTTDNIQYRTRRHELGGRTQIVEDMASFQEKFPGEHFDIGDVSTHHDVALLTWVLVQADGKVFAQGHDQIRVNADGKISSIITFPPSTKTP